MTRYTGRLIDIKVDGKAIQEFFEMPSAPEVVSPSFRERIADWITGGKYSTARIAQIICEKRFAPRLWKAEDALNAIAAMETKNANATVRRMARTAREGVK